MLLRCLLMVALCLLAAAGSAKDQEPEDVPSYRAVRTAAEMVIDGKLEEPAWSAATPADGFRQRDPKEGEPATERTEVRVAYDDHALYVGARLYDREPGRINRRLARRDDDVEADSLRVYLDPRHDHRSGVIFELSAAGVQSDAVLFNDSWDDSSWDGVWESAVAVDAEGWTAEIKIPLSELRFPAGDQQTWGFNVTRFIQRKNESDWLELVPKKESGLASRMAHLTGLDGLRPRPHLALLPYTVSKGEFIAPTSSFDPFNDGSRMSGAAGLDVKVGVNGSLVLDGTINPDFGQVEVDPAVVNLTDFETFFDEKRPFFIEGSQLFSNFARNGSNNFWGFNRSDPQLFYSRRIGRAPQGEIEADYVSQPAATSILGAGKLTGKTKSGWSLAVLDAVTGREWADLSNGVGAPGRQEIEPFTNALVARAFREAGQFGYGVMGTALNRNLRDPQLADDLVEQAYVVGADGYAFLDAKKEWVVSGGGAWSRIAGSEAAIDRVQRLPQHYFQRPDAAPSRLDPAATSLSGWSGNVNLNRQSGRFRVNSALWATSPGFDSNDLGFNWKSDRWGGHLVGEYRKTDPGRLFRNAFVAIAKWYTFNFEGDKQGDGVNLFSNVRFLNYWGMGLNLNHRFRAQDDRFTRGGPSALSGSSSGGGVWLQSDSRKKISGRVNTFYQRNEFGGWGFEGNLSLDLKPWSSLTVSLGPEWNRTHARAQWVGAIEDQSAAHGQRYVFSDMEQHELIVTARINWILSPRVSLQVYAQPLISVGDYDGFKEFSRPRAFEFRGYGTQAGAIAYRASTDEFEVDPDGAGPAAPFLLTNPDFNYKSLRINAIFRWEYRPGSTLYVAWTQARQDSADPGDFELGRDADHLLGAPADDVFLIKLAYRFGK